MKNYNLNNSPFSHAHSSTWWKKSTYINWQYNTKENDTTFYIDSGLQKGISEKNDGKIKILWGLESPHYNGNFIQNIKNNLNEVIDTYDLILTYSDELINLNEKFKWIPGNGFWIEEPKIYNKTKLISIVTSNKKFTPQQMFRTEFVEKYKDIVDVYGNGYNRIQKKEEGLKDYMFSVAIENEIHDTYFTEKILDCFATGTIPIYSGTKKIVEHFNSDGILFLDEINLNDLNEELYFSKLDAIKDNFERVLEYDVLEDWFYKKYLI